MLSSPKPSPFEIFAAKCRELGLPEPVPEHPFAQPVRDWKFDAAFIEQRIAVEFDGAVWSRGRHTRGAGFLADADKFNEAQIRGWIVLRFETKRAGDERTLGLVQRAMSARGHTSTQRHMSGRNMAALIAVGHGPPPAMGQD